MQRRRSAPTALPVRSPVAPSRGGTTAAPPLSTAADGMQRSDQTSAGGDAEAAAQAKLLRETAAARAHRHDAACGGGGGGQQQHQQHPPPTAAAPATRSSPPSSPAAAAVPFSELRRRLEEHPPPAAAADSTHPPHASAPSPPAPATSQYARADRHSGKDAGARQALEMPQAYDRDAEYARRLQAEEEARSHAHLSPGARSRRLAAEEADAKMARDMQQAEEESQRRVREDNEAAAQLAARQLREQEARAGDSEDVGGDEELARRLQRDEVESANSAASPHSRSSLSHQSSLSRGSGVQRQASGNGDEDGQDGVILLPSEADEAEEHYRQQQQEQQRRGLPGPGGLQRQQSQRTREQIIRRLHQMQGNYPGLAGDRTASFRFAPNGNLVVGWDEEDEERKANEEAASAAGHGASSSSAAASSDAEQLSEGTNSPLLTADEQAAQRAMFAQFERENAARRARQAAGEHKDEEEEEEQSSSGSSGGGLWGMLGGALHRHVSNSRQGLPFPFSVMVDPAELRAMQERSRGGSIGSSSGPQVMQGPGGMRVIYSSGGGMPGGVFSSGLGSGFRRAPYGFSSRGGQAEVDIDRMNYEQLLQLEDALGSVKPKVKGADAHQLDTLPVRAWKKPPAKQGSAAASSSSSAAAAGGDAGTGAAEDECSICMCEFEDGDAVKTLPCFHHFHAAEIDKWLLTNETCPVCRIPVSGAPPNQ